MMASNDGHESFTGNGQDSIVEQGRRMFEQTRLSPPRVGGRSGSHLGLPVNNARQRSQSPSYVAANLAAARSAGASPAALSRRSSDVGHSTQMQEQQKQDARVRQVAARLAETRYRASEDSTESSERTDSTSIAPTGSLVKMFEQNKQPQTVAKPKPTPKPKPAIENKTQSGSAFVSSTTENLPEKRPALPPPKPSTNEATAKSDVRAAAVQAGIRAAQQSSARNAVPPASAASGFIGIPKARPEPPPARRTVISPAPSDATSAIPKTLAAEPTKSPPRKQDVPSSLPSPPVKPKRLSSRISSDTALTRSTSRGSSMYESAPEAPEPGAKPSLDLDDAPKLPPRPLDLVRSQTETRPPPQILNSTSKREPRRLSDLTDSQSGPAAEAAARSRYIQRTKYAQSSLRHISPHITGDSLANAIVGANLATSSRPQSPSRPTSQVTPMNTDDRKKHHGHSLPFMGSRDRDPSPQKKGMPKTLRKQQSDSSSSEEGPFSKHKKKRHIRPKHPNKHHEGDRKRWRDAVTERERKRYEGLWAANRGLLIDDARSQDQVQSMVVREIWSRSRLPNPVLGEIWDLVDSQRTGMLQKDEFVVGLWLIDQRLKGRKLPPKVSEHVWGSVRYIQGLKVPKKPK